MRIMVTGAAGLIGSGIAALLRQQHEVVGVDLRSGPEVSHLIDICDRAALKTLIRGTDAIVHVAALHAPHVGRIADAEFLRINVDGTQALLDLALSAGAQRFVLTSSTSVYGHALEPSNEAVWIDESVTPSPRDVYDRTKLQAETLVRSASGAGLETAILRISRCFPEPVRDMTFYRLHRGIDRRDVAHAHALALEAASASAEIYVISAAPPFTRKDCKALLENAPRLIAERLPQLAERFDRLGWDLPSSIGRVYSPAKALAGLGFAPRFGVEAVLDGDCDPRPLG
ncbi:MAG: NAD(P)-dependent oxidoreductase [Pseudomonadota bacterium]|nr:NAD(P)-dependent oxidoreductase [Pseudomonadota bacterium]